MDVEYGYDTTGHNNGQIGSMKDWMSGEEVVHTYDTLSRLTRAETVGSQWGQSYTLDGLGNLTAQTVTTLFPMLFDNSDALGGRLMPEGAFAICAPGPEGSLNPFCYLLGLVLSAAGTDAGGGGGTTLRPTDAATDATARNTLKARLKGFAGSNCDKVFGAVIDGYTTKDIIASVSSTEFYNVNSQANSDLTQDQVSGNGSSTLLSQSLNSNDPVASTLISATVPAVLLGANFFSNSAATFQGNVLLHELLHAYTNWNDTEVFQTFGAYGLKNIHGDTEDISAWMSTDCLRTPTSMTWW